MSYPKTFEISITTINNQEEIWRFPFPKDMKIDDISRELEIKYLLSDKQIEKINQILMTSIKSMKEKQKRINEAQSYVVNKWYVNARSRKQTLSKTSLWKNETDRKQFTFSPRINKKSEKICMDSQRSKTRSMSIETKLYSDFKTQRMKKTKNKLSRLLDSNDKEVISKLNTFLSMENIKKQEEIKKKEEDDAAAQAGIKEGNELEKQDNTIIREGKSKWMNSEEENNDEFADKIIEEDEVDTLNGTHVNSVKGGKRKRRAHRKATKAKNPNITWNNLSPIKNHKKLSLSSLNNSLRIFSAKSSLHQDKPKETRKNKQTTFETDLIKDLKETNLILKEISFDNNMDNPWKTMQTPHENKRKRELTVSTPKNRYNAEKLFQTITPQITSKNEWNNMINVNSNESLYIKQVPNTSSNHTELPSQNNTPGSMSNKINNSFINSEVQSYTDKTLNKKIRSSSMQLERNNMKKDETDEPRNNRHITMAIKTETGKEKDKIGKIFKNDNSLSSFSFLANIDNNKGKNWTNRSISKSKATKRNSNDGYRNRKSNFTEAITNIIESPKKSENSRNSKSGSIKETQLYLSEFTGIQRVSIPNSINNNTVNDVQNLKANLTWKTNSKFNPWKMKHHIHSKINSHINYWVHSKQLDVFKKKWINYRIHKSKSRDEKQFRTNLNSKPTNYTTTQSNKFYAKTITSNLCRKEISKEDNISKSKGKVIKTLVHPTQSTEKRAYEFKIKHSHIIEKMKINKIKEVYTYSNSIDWNIETWYTQFPKQWIEMVVQPVVDYLQSANVDLRNLSFESFYNISRQYLELYTSW